MADGKYFGVSHPVIAPVSSTGYDLTKKFTNGAAIGVTISPQYSEASLYGDNVLDEYVNEFREANITLNVTAMPVSAANVLFGHTVDQTTNEITYNASDSSNYVGFGFIPALMDGAKKYRAIFLPKVKFTEGDESYTTKGDSITFVTPTLNGKATVNDTGVWRIKSDEFDTEAEALAWIDEQFGK